MSAFRRSLSGGGLSLNIYRAEGSPGQVAFAVRMPRQIFPIDVPAHSGGGFRAHRHAFLAGTPGIQISWGFQRKLGAGLFGGDGFVLQSITGNGRAWIELSGEVVLYDLPPGRTLRVHPGHVGLFQESVRFDITMIKGVECGCNHYRWPAWRILWRTTRARVPMNPRLAASLTRSSDSELEEIPTAQRVADLLDPWEARFPEMSCRAGQGLCLGRVGRACARGILAVTESIIIPSW